MGILWSERSYIFREEFALKRGELPLQHPDLQIRKPELIAR